MSAGEGCTAHPTQALLDLYTLQKHFGEVKGLTVAMIGDLRHSRVVRSNLWSLKTFGVRVILSGPESMRAPDLEELAPFVPLEEALRQVDAVMMLRVQLERHRRDAVFVGGGVPPGLRIDDGALCPHAAPRGHHASGTGQSGSGDRR